MTARVTVLCPGCGGDWELALPPAGELTVEYCECGALLELDASGHLRPVRAARIPAGPTPDPEAGAPPERVADVVRRLFAAKG